MFKIIGRIIVILLVAALVAGGLYALVQNGSTNSTAVAPSRQFQSSGTNGTFAPREQFGDRGGEDRFSLGRGVGGTLVTFLEISLITFIVIQVQKVLAKSPQKAVSRPD
jgi:hypothetical protein